jgi:membrane protein CcdC involved in cytochrome C biogenesis
MISKLLEAKLWKAFNIAVRVTGYWFIIMSSGFIVCAVVLFVHPSKNINNEFIVLGVILAIILLIAGIFFVKLREYYPKHIISREDNGVRS